MKITSEDLYFLIQLINAEETASKKLIESEEKRNIEAFNANKKEIFKFNREIAKIIEKWS